MTPVQAWFGESQSLRLEIPTLKEFRERRANAVNDYKAWKTFVWEENGTLPLSKLYPMPGSTQLGEQIASYVLVYAFFHRLTPVYVQNTTTIHESPDYNEFFKEGKEEPLFYHQATMYCETWLAFFSLSIQTLLV